MTNARVLTAIDAGVKAGSVNAARAALRRGDWAARPAARRRFESVLLDAMLAAEGAAADATLVHPMRVAALRMRGVSCDPGDEDGTAAAYAAAGPPPAPTRWPVVTLAVSATLVSIVVVIGWLMLRTERVAPLRTTYQRVLPAPSADAFARGGVPLADAGLEALFAKDLPQLVIALDRVATAGTKADRALGQSEWMRARGGAMAAAWTRFVEVYIAWAETAADTMERTLAVDQLQSAVRAVDEQLASAGLGYWLELDQLMMAGEARALVYCYRVEQVTPMRGGGASHHVYDVRRLDNLNVVHELLGLHSPSIGAPLVLVDQVEDVVRETFLPALGPYPSFELGDKAWLQHGDTARRDATAASEAIREELITALGVDGKHAREIGALLYERKRMLSAWADRDLQPSLFLPAGYIDQLPADAPVSRKRLRAIEAALSRHDAARIVTRIEDLLVASVRGHELQHAIDASEARPYPPEVEVRAGAEETEAGENYYGRRLANEVSANLAELARGPLPKFNLWKTAGPAFDHTRSSVHGDTAFVLLEVLARALAYPTGDLGDRRELGALLVRLSDTPTDQLRDAARRAWQQLSGAPLPDVSVDTATRPG